MLRRFLKDSAIYAISALLTRGLSIILIPIYTRFLAPADYGAFDILLIAGTLANYVVGLEMSQGLAREFADATSEDEKISYISTAMYACTACYCTFLLATLPASATIAQILLQSPEFRFEVMLALFAVAANGLFFLLQDMLRWQLQPGKHAIVGIAYFGVSAAIACTLVVAFDLGIRGLLIGQVVGAASGIVVAIGMGAAQRVRRTFAWGKLRRIVAYSAPQVISGLTAYAMLYFDRFLIKEFLSLQDVGIYSVAARIASTVSLLMVGFQNGYIPLVFLNHSDAETPRQMARVFRSFWLVALCAVLFLACFSEEIVGILLSSDYAGSARYIPFMALSIILSGSFIFAPGIFIARKVLIVAATNLLFAILSVSINTIIVPMYGMIGASAVSVVLSFLLFSTFVAFNQKYYPIPFDWVRLSAATGLFLLAICALMLGNFWGELAWVWSIIVFGLSALLLLRVLLTRDEVGGLYEQLRRRFWLIVQR